MLLSAVSVLVVAQSSSEIPEGLMNNPVLTVLHIFTNSSFTQPNITEIRQRMLFFEKELTCVLPYLHLRLLWRLRQTATLFFSFLCLRNAYVQQHQQFHAAILTNVPILQRRCAIWSHMGWKNKCIRFLEFRHVGRFYNNPYPTAFPYGNGMVLHFYQQQESSMTKTVHKVINKGL